MESIIIEGVIKTITPAENFTAKDGTIHTEKNLVVETEERYPQSVAIRVIDKNAMDDYQIGERIRCNVDLRAAQGQSGRWFNTIRAWKIEVV